MRVVHTSDWHLGHRLHDRTRELEHRRFLSWLGDLLDRERADALIVAGDVFDSATPPASAQALWFSFLSDLYRRLPGLDVLIIGGNHDSPSRLEAPGPLLVTHGVRVVGGLSAGTDPERLLAPISDRDGNVRAWVAMVPFLRPLDLPPGVADGGGDPLVHGVRAVYRELFDAARDRRQPGQALIATGHCYMVGTALSELSERRILGGNQHALPVDLFPADAAYVALGHLHRAQRVGGRDTVRYSGSPLPLSLAEASYRHQVVVVDFDGEVTSEVRAVEVPRVVDIVRVPSRGAAPLVEVLAQLAALEVIDGRSEEERPFLEVCVAVDRPEPELRRRIEDAVHGKWPRLAKISVTSAGTGQALAELAASQQLADLDPLDVFAKHYRREHDREPPAELSELFAELLHRAQEQLE